MPPRDLPQFDDHWIEVAGELKEMADNIQNAVDGREPTWLHLHLRPWQQTAIKAIYRGLIEDDVIKDQE